MNERAAALNGIFEIRFEDGRLITELIVPFAEQ
jgi:hypothetical protein